MEFFFYGTLLDAEVVAAVIGRRTLLPCRPAFVEGYRRVCRLHADYPVLVRCAGGRVDGSLVAGLGTRDAERLRAFEGDEYALIEMAVMVVGDRPRPALTFMAKRPVPASSVEWSPERWRGRHKRHYLSRLRAGPRSSAACAGEPSANRSTLRSG